MVRPLQHPIISPDPLIWIRDYALEPDFCHHLIEKFRNEEEGNKYKGKTGWPPRLNTIKNSQDLSMDSLEHWADETKVIRDNLRVCFQEYVNHIQSHIVMPTYEHNDQIPYAQFPVCDGNIVDYGFQIQETEPFGYYDWHEDSLCNFQEKQERLATYLYYLNDIYEDGCTEFMNGFKVPPRQGRLLMFPSTWTYMHRGGILHGYQNKYIATGWLCRDHNNNLSLMEQTVENTELKDEDINELLLDYEPPTEGEELTLEPILQ
tara:strand:- start:773 stop:1558 length:786 start_codon:yes stop_codon:yes gene_type:complete